jgi:integrase/recombinase XerD
MKRLLFWLRPKEKPKHLFLDVFREFLDKLAVENDLNPDTLKKHQGIYNNVSLFLLSKNHASCNLQAIKPALMEDLRLWLHTNLITCTHSHSSRHLEMCKRVLRYSVLMGYTEHSPIEPLKTKRDQTKEVIHLEEHELNKMIRRAFASDMYNIVADLYLFQCFTGLSYGDLWSWEIIQDGRFKFITSKRKKTGKGYCSEYTPQAEVILRRYNGQLPKITNQQYNRVLKEIAVLLNIKKNLTTHTARKTFATVKNNEGFTLETIADMMGNTPDVARKHYIKGSRERLKLEIARLAN